MASKTLLLVVVLSIVMVLFVSSEAVAREMTEASKTVDTSEKSKGEVNDAKYHGGGYGGGHGGYGGGRCRFGCCGRGGYYGCRCYYYANQKPDADYAAVNP